MTTWDVHRKQVSFSDISVTAMMAVSGIRFMRSLPCALCFAHLCKGGIGFAQVQLLNLTRYIKRKQQKASLWLSGLLIALPEVVFLMCTFVNKGT